VSAERIHAELALLREGGVDVEYFPEQNAVLYRDVPTAGASLNLPSTTDVAVLVPGGYPATAIDLGALPVGSPLLGRAKGVPNGPVVTVAGQDFKFVSFHPYQNEGGIWDPNKQGFHTYYGWICSWMNCLR
jgi:hypothetical protein